MRKRTDCSESCFVEVIGNWARLGQFISANTLCGIDVLLEFFSLINLEIMTLSLDFITPLEGKVLVCFIDLVFKIFLPLFFIDLSFMSIWVNEILLHHLLYMFLLFSVLSQLLLYEPCELLLFSYLSVSFVNLHRSLWSDLLHMQIKDLLIAQILTTHEDSLTKFMNESRGIDET